MEFKDKLKKLRLEKGITQEELANLIFVSRSAIAKWENGYGMPSDDSINLLSEIFQVDKNELLINRDLEENVVNKRKTISNQKKIIISLSSISFLLTIAIIVLIIIFNSKTKVYKVEQPLGMLNNVVCSQEKECRYFVKKKDGYIESDQFGTNTNGQSVFLSFLPLSENEIKSLTIQNKSQKYSFYANNMVVDENGTVYDVYYAYIDKNYNYVKKGTSLSSDTYYSKGWYTEWDQYYYPAKKVDNSFSIPDNEYMKIIYIKCLIWCYIDGNLLKLNFSYNFLVE